MHNEMTKRPLRKHEFSQTNRRGATSARRCERSLPGRFFASDLAVSLWVIETRATSLCRSGHVSPGDGDASNLAGSLQVASLRVMETRATSLCRSGQIALKGCHSDFTGPYTSPPPIGYPTRDAAAGDPVVAAVETKSKGDGFWSCIEHPVSEVMPVLLKSGQSASQEEAVEEMKDC
ncbi:hypothetical protein F2Q70_00043342 [Brassica cretica]|uniref:Uncharacterized protein n=1 Tax=Brassica cretica TaxID=69181 RepID=A0A8S9KJ28_BRACR|nr:hypothetical protein F2Q70_00043342 [Brassica cretica]